MPTKYISIHGFKGGLSRSGYEPLDQQKFVTAQDLDIFTLPNVLRPHPKKLTSILLPAGSATNVKLRNSYIASNGKFYFIGEATIAAATNVTLYSTASLESSSTWTLDFNTNTGAIISNALEEYKDGLFFGYGTTLKRWGNLSGTPSASDISTGLTSSITHIKHHPGLGILFFAHNSGKTIGRYNNTTVTLNALTLDADDRIVSLEPYGSFLLIGVRSNGGTKRSKILVWDGSAPSVADIMEIPDVGLQGCRIVEGIVVAVCAQNATSNTSMRIYQGVPGGEFQKTYEKSWPGANIGISSSAESIRDNTFESYGGRLYFAPIAASSAIDIGIFAYDPSSRTLALDRINSQNTTTADYYSFRHYGNRIISTFSNSAGTTFFIDEMGGATSTTPNGVYESTIFDLNDGLSGKIKTIFVNHKPIPSSTGFTVAIKHFGHYTWGTSVPSSEAYQELLGPQGSGGSTGKTQSTDNASYTEITDPVLKEARKAQLKISFDEVSGLNAAEIVFPILAKVETLK